MPDLSFQVEKAEPLPFAMAPLLVFKLRVTNADPEEPIHAVTLRCQIQIEATRRHYNAEDKERLFELFGEPELWGRSLRSMLWTHASVNIPPFTESAIVDLPVPCTYDLNVAAAKYFYALEDGEVPLSLLFSGTIFYMAEGESLQVTQIPWSKEATFRLPVRIWKEMMEIYYPNSTWLCLRKDVFDRLYRYKLSQGLLTWEEALESLIPEADEDVGDQSHSILGKTKSNGGKS